MTKKLWVFGDSFSTPFDDNTLINFGPSYIKWKGYVPKIYSQILEMELGFELNGIYQGGLDNYTILEKVCENIHSIVESDILIIGWSLTHRFRIADPSGKNLPIQMNPSFETVNNLNFVKKQSIDEILINRNDHSHLFEYEMYQWTRLINKALNCKIIHYNWPTHKKYETIKTETKNEIGDKHFSENGHKELANDIMDLIKSNNRIEYLGKFNLDKCRKIL